MSTDALRIVSLAALPPTCVAALEASPFGPFRFELAPDMAAVQARVDAGACDALLLDLSSGPADFQSTRLREVAVLFVAADLSAPAVLACLQHGAQDVLRHDELADESLARRIRVAIEHRRREREARTAYATDLSTGLPHQQQLIEHMSHLLALREREPSSMAVLALRIEGLATTEARLGREAANVLRRRLAVRLRAGVRASDVVAALGDASFGVLLGSILAPADAERVGAKLLKALLDPFTVAGETLAVSVALGIGQYPQDGAQPDALLRRALGLAAAAAAQGRAGLASVSDAGSRVAQAANDD